MHVPSSQLSFTQGIVPSQLTVTPQGQGQINQGVPMPYLPSSLQMAPIPTMISSNPSAASSISDHDVQRIAYAVKALMQDELAQIIHPYKVSIENLEKQNRDLARREKVLCLV